MKFRSFPVVIAISAVASTLLVLSASAAGARGEPIAAAQGDPRAEAQGEPVAAFELRRGGEVFWDGPEHLSQPVPVVSHEIQNAICQAGGPGCIDYRLVLRKTGQRLRVAIDYPFRADLGGEGDFLALYLIDPEGEEVAHIGTPDPYYSAELFAENPAPGAWTARVIPQFASDTTFRMRAKLERTNSTRTGQGKSKRVRTLLPNLRMVPPFEFTLETPAFVGGYGVLGFDAGPARGVVPTNGCLATELATHNPSPVRCLRFSTGPENIGQGRLQLIFQPDGSGLTEGPAFQRFDRSDATTEDRPAGRYTYHLQHGHYHHDAFGDYTLWSVDRVRRSLTAAGGGRKQGFCMHDLQIVSWRAFDNDPQDSVDQNCGFDSGILPTHESIIGLARGWADIYIYSQEGMYVDFGDNPDGLYVVRVSANQEGAIDESTTRDNFSYALVQITGNKVEVVERGYGSDPWDPRRRVVENDLLPPTVDG